MIKVLALFLFGVQALAGSSTDESCENLRISANDVSVTWSDSFKLLEESILVERTADVQNEDCDFFVTFTSGRARSYQSRAAYRGISHVHYQLHSNAGLSYHTVLKDFPHISNRREVIQGEIKKNRRSATVRYYFTVDKKSIISNRYVSAGTYTDNFEIKLWDTKFSQFSFSDNPADTEGINVAIAIASNIRISLVGPGGRFDETDVTENLNFGVLRKGKSRRADLLILSNTGYSVKFSSQFNSNLKNQNPAISSKVPYLVKVNRKHVDLSNSSGSPVEVIRKRRNSGRFGDRNSIKITIDDFNNVVAGQYKDVITITTEAI